MRRLALVTILLAPLVAHAGDGTITDNDKTRTITCKDAGTAEVAGNGNTVTVTGPCAKVSVTGNHNTVSIDQAGTIAALGNDNTVTWKAGAGGKDPEVSNLGSRNVVRKAK